MSARDAASYDPHGYIVRHRDRIYRAIEPASRQFYASLIEDGTAERLHRSHGVVRTTIAPSDEIAADGRLVLEHEKIWPVTYCAEWCAPMLRDAARLTLDLSLDLLDSGRMLQDAHPWNILFSGARPVFVDFTSIVPVDQHLLWPAYTQFRTCFINPLLLTSMGRGRLARLLLLNPLRGVQTADLVENAGPRLFTGAPRLLLSAFAERHVLQRPALKESIKRAAARKRPEVDLEMRRRFLGGLQRELNHIRLPARRSGWAQYYQTLAPEAAPDAKRAVIAELFARLRPASVIDLGSNTGVFSMIAAEAGARVLAVDGDEACVERLYAAARERDLAITPIVADVLCPTPAFGFMGAEFPTLFDRSQAEIVLCLGLMHHLHVAGGQSFDRIAGLLARIATKFVIFEYVDAADANVALIDSGRQANYTYEAVASALKTRFASVETFDSDRPTRKLLLLRHE